MTVALAAVGLVGLLALLGWRSRRRRPTTGRIAFYPGGLTGLDVVRRGLRRK